jgi:BirA family transcriptional regulator, biotin operon repressor / biotin---[acetyl-CoA-carboxylase] ligase
MDESMNLLPLLQKLADGEYHSGEGLGQSLGVSRAAIWKQIRSVRELGVAIDAVTGRGYRIAGGLDLLDKDIIEQGLLGEAQSLRGRTTLHFSTGSTNTDAMKCAGMGLDRCLVIAEHQSAGRGRRGRQWVSPFGHNLYMSLMWTFQSGIAALEGLSLVCALAVKDALEGSGFQQIALKWPNDVLLDGRKLAGILLEVSGDVAGPCQVVMGIGINTRISAEAGAMIDQPYSDLSSADASLVRRNELAVAVINRWVLALQQFEREGFAVFRDRWMAFDAYHGSRVRIVAGSVVRSGVSAGIDLSGRLLLDTDSGQITIAGGELMPGLRPE